MNPTNWIPWLVTVETADDLGRYRYEPVHVVYARRAFRARRMARRFLEETGLDDMYSFVTPVGGCTPKEKRFVESYIVAMESQNDEENTTKGGF